MPCVLTGLTSCGCDLMRCTALQWKGEEQRCARACSRLTARCQCVFVSVCQLSCVCQREWHKVQGRVTPTDLLVQRMA